MTQLTQICSIGIQNCIEMNIYSMTQLTQIRSIGIQNCIEMNIYSMTQLTQIRSIYRTELNEYLNYDSVNANTFHRYTELY